MFVADARINFTTASRKSTAFFKCGFVSQNSWNSSWPIGCCSTTYLNDNAKTADSTSHCQMTSTAFVYAMQATGGNLTLYHAPNYWQGLWTHSWKAANKANSACHPSRPSRVSKQMGACIKQHMAGVRCGLLTTSLECVVSLSAQGQWNEHQCQTRRWRRLNLLAIGDLPRMQTPETLCHPKTVLIHRSKLFNFSSRTILHFGIWCKYD